MLDEIIKGIKPSVAEEKKVNQIVQSVLKKLKPEKDVEIKLGGSYAKGTWIAGHHDVDVFVVFKEDIDISKRLEKMLKKSFKKIETVHGSRDYFRIKEKEFYFEIIPVVKVKNAEVVENSTDASVFHVEWVKSHLTPKIADQVRLTKQFFKANGVYGAETYRNGFSGYVVEILVIYYGSFLDILKHISHWKEGTVIDPQASGRGERHKGAPLIVIDPVQSSRNAAAAVSQEKVMELIKVCRKFMQKPSKELFQTKKIKKSDLKEKDLILEFTPLKGKEDVVLTKIVKAIEFLELNLKKEGFKIKERGIEFDKKVVYWVSVENKEVSKEIKHLGPPLEMKEHVVIFKKKHKRVIIEDGKVVALKVRKFTKLKDLTKEFLKDKWVKERVKSVVIH
ncbi:MAG: CCA tRNA nucleotidyltransferase [Candidatus Nanoarchaeia archaeon]